MIWVKKLNSILLPAVLVLVQLSASAQNYMGKSVKVRLFSSTPVEDIKAVNVKAVAVLVGKTGEIVVQVPIKGFEFDRKLMQEHFNENYMESDRYPLAKFKGTIGQPIDFSRDGVYEVKVTGVLTVHGVDRPRSIPGKIVVGGGVVQLFSDFNVSCADHRIKIPTLIMTKVAEVINIKLEGQLSPIK